MVEPNNKQKYIDRFKAIYKAKSGKELSGEEALEHFEKLICLVRAIYKPIPNDQQRKINR